MQQWRSAAFRCVSCPAHVNDNGVCVRNRNTCTIDELHKHISPHLKSFGSMSELIWPNVYLSVCSGTHSDVPGWLDYVIADTLRLKCSHNKQQQNAPPYHFWDVKFEKRLAIEWNADNTMPNTLPTSACTLSQTDRSFAEKNECLLATASINSCCRPQVSSNVESIRHYPLECDVGILDLDLYPMHNRSHKLWKQFDNLYWDDHNDQVDMRAKVGFFMLYLYVCQKSTKVKNSRVFLF